MPDSEGRSERRSKMLRDLLTFVSIGLSVLLCLFFLVAMHYLVVAIVPEAIAHTPEVLLVIVFSLGLAVGTGTSSGRQERGCMGGTVLIVMLYVFIALVVSFSTKYPGLYTMPYALFGAIGTANLFTSCREMGTLFAEIPKWRGRPETFTADYIKQKLMAFDRRARFVTSTVLGMVAVVVAAAVLALATTDNVSGWFLLIVAPFLWTATVLLVYTRIVLRLKGMYIEGHDVSERHVIQPVAYAVLVSVIVLVVALILAADASPLHYSSIVAFIENLFDIERSREISGGLGHPSFSSGPAPGGGTAGGQSAPPAGAGADLDALFEVLRYVILGVAGAGVIAYVVISLIRLRRGGGRPATLFSRTVRRGRNRFRRAFLHAVRMWRTLMESLRGMFRLWERRRYAKSGLQGFGPVGSRISEEAGKRIERNAVLRWYRKLLAWGRRNGVEAAGTETADEYLEMLAETHPEHSEVAQSIAEAFDVAFYAQFRMGREQLRAYVRDIKQVIKG